MRSKFVRGLVDGALSTLGIIIGASAGSQIVIIAAAVGGTVANGISNMLSAFTAEEAGLYEELRKVEKAMVDREMKDSELERQIHKETVVAGIFDGAGTLAGGVLPIIPYLILSYPQAMFASIGLVMIAVAIIGLYIGKLSKRSMTRSALKMVACSVGVAAIVYLIQMLIVP